MSESTSRKYEPHLDWMLLIPVFALIAFGVVAVAIASFKAGTPEQPLLKHIVENPTATKQVIFMVVAFVVCTFITLLNYELLRKLAFTSFAFGILLLMVTFVLSKASGVKAWLDFFYGFTIQPSEFIKLAIILQLSKMLSRVAEPLSTWREFVHVMIYVGITGAVILIQGEMGSLLVILFMVAAMFYFANVKAKTLWLLVAAAVIGILILWVAMTLFNADSYRLQRILAFLNPDLYSLSDAYQMQQSKMAIGSGGLYGIGQFVDGSMSQLDYVPADWTDFIFATIGESFGFIVCTSIILLYLFIILRMLYLARYTRDKFGQLVIIGVMSMFTFHVIENIGMTMGLMPITGIPLPFLSYGGSNMVTSITGIGMVLNVTLNRATTLEITAPQMEVYPYLPPKLRHQSIRKLIRKKKPSSPKLK